MRADYGFQLKVYYGRQNSSELSQNGYGAFNAYLALEKLWGGRFDLALYGTNLTNKNYLTYAEDTIGVGVVAVKNIPRLFGVRLSMNLVR